MGVPGLTTFIDTRARQLLTDVKLSNIRIIIDGNNLYHFLYYHYKVRHECAGDYDEFDSACSSFFGILHSCAIEPFVVFDGAHADDGRKFKVSLNRAAERIHLAGFLSHGHRGRILPILAYEVFLRHLDAAGVPHVTCYLEADAEIAALAKEWNCPVLTNDSDFFIYDLPAGVVLLDYLNLNVHKHRVETETSTRLGCSRQGGGNDKHKSSEKKLSNDIDNLSNEISENISNSDNSVNVSDTNEQMTKSECKSVMAQYYLNVQVFYYEKLLALYKLQDKRMLALAATLLGNDVINRKHFEDFYAKARLVKQSSQRQGSSAGVAASLFQWLKNKRNFEEVFNEILSCITEGKRDSVKTLLIASIESYSVKNCTLVEYLDSAIVGFAAENSCNISLNSLENLGNSCNIVADDDTSELTSSVVTQKLNSTLKKIHYRNDLPSSSSLEPDVRYVSNRVPAQLPQPLPLSRRGNTLPRWFLEAVCSGRVPSRALSAVMRRCVILLAQVEVCSFPSAYESAMSLRQCFYSILLSVDLCQNAEEMFVTEYGRDQKNLQKKGVATVQFLSKGAAIPKLCDIPVMTCEARFEFLEAALLDLVVVGKSKRAGLGELSTDLRLIVLTLVYWIAHAKPSVTIINMKSLLLCHLCLGALDNWILSDVKSASSESLNAHNKPLDDPSKDKPDLQVPNERVTMPKISRNKVSKNVISSNLKTNNKRNSTAEAELKETKLTLLGRFNHAPSVNNACRFDGRLIHVYSQYQACLLGTIHLQQLLLLQSAQHSPSATICDAMQSSKNFTAASVVAPPSLNPLTEESSSNKYSEDQTFENKENSPCEGPSRIYSVTLNPATLFNGTFLYNLSRELEDRVNPDLYIQQLLKRDSVICQRYHELVDLILSIVPAAYFQSAVTKQRAKKSKGSPRNNTKSPNVVHRIILNQNVVDGEDASNNSISDVNDLENNVDKRGVIKKNKISRRNVENSGVMDNCLDIIMPSDDNDSSDCDDFDDANNRFAFLRQSSEISL